jgi:hypothetical protein
MTHSSTILPHEQMIPFSTSRQKKFTADELIGLEKLKRYYAAETQKCVDSLAVVELSEHEFRFASAEFKEFIEIPRNKKEPIYIAVTILADNTFNPGLQEIMDGITSGKPYHSFIKQSFGETWPLLLRLYYGLDKFRISMEQFHSMIKICYWQDRSFIVENIPLANEKNQLTDAGNLLINNSMYSPEKNQQKTKFIEDMSATAIPAGERMLQVIKLDPQYFRVAMMASQSNPHYTNAPLLSMHDALYVPTLGEYSVKQTLAFAQQQGAEMLVSALQIGHAYHRIFFMKRKVGTKLIPEPVLLLPSQTMVEKYIHSLNPTRKIKIIRRIGPFGPNVMEQHSDKDERVINLFAPGITNPLVTHAQIVFPWAGLEHDEYHVLYEGQLSKINYGQLCHAKNVLHNILGKDSKVITSEIFRSIDRERAPVLGEHTIFLELIKYLFANNVQDYNSELKLSSFIIMADMVLSPQHWPYYKIKKAELVPALLHANKSDTKVSTKEVEDTIRQLGNKTAQDIPFTSILLLCRYYLSDPLLCVALLYITTKAPAHAAPYGWHKSHAGYFSPTLTIDEKSYSFEELYGLTGRANLVLNAKFPGKKVNSAVANDLVIVRIPEVDEVKLNAMTSAGGIVIEPAGKDRVAVIAIQSTALDKTLRDKLNLRKVALSFTVDNPEERCNYLAGQGITVEATNDTRKFMFTFFKSQLPILEEVKNNWRMIRLGK